MTQLKHFLVGTLFALGLSVAPMAAGCGGEHDHDHDHDHELASYVCPMHPDEQSDEPGECSVCGMPLEEESAAEHEEHSH